MARDGHSNYIKSDLSNSIQKQSAPNVSSLKKVKKKLIKVLDRGYIPLLDDVRSLT